MDTEHWKILLTAIEKGSLGAAGGFSFTRPVKTLTMLL